MCAINRMAEQELLNPSGESKLFDTEEPRAAKDSMGPGEPTFVGSGNYRSLARASTACSPIR